jgi:hypothetical protein
MDGVATDGFHLVFQETTPIQAANNRELFSKGMGKGGDWPPTLSPSTRKFEKISFSSTGCLSSPQGRRLAQMRKKAYHRTTEWDLEEMYITKYCTVIVPMYQLLVQILIVPIPLKS